MKHHLVASTLAIASHVNALHSHHMKHKLVARQNNAANTPLVVTNNCAETVYPGIATQHGVAPGQTGFELTSGSTVSQSVSEDWQGRIWGRTNCSFNAQGRSNGGGPACTTGDCNGVIPCQAAGTIPVTLAEFTLDAGDGQTYYDISLVDGYNLPLAIVLVPHGNSSLDDIPPNLTNPSCEGTGSLLAPSNFNPYGSGTFLGTNSSYPLPFETKVTTSNANQWCPWDLQVDAPSKPGDNVYPYPDGNIQRPAFDPCFSACAKYNSDQYCCLGKYNGPDQCSPNYYAKAAKTMCPDTYSFAYDDQSSTFIIPSGAGVEVVFCPGGRSTVILSTKAAQLRELANTGSVSSSSGSNSTASSFAIPNLDARPWYTCLVFVVGFLWY
ncbi:Osmotin, thaumatin-like protein [Aureobasidium pullulans]|uniref:Osmotin, thaumatin-like protein n=1 Tax=Aureobasidium pullulans TaxID=5580 RepID=A0A4S8T237_AURPU|nr:Osmotin, thaumatin-like protein [Aureobasidium pullulans]